MFSGLRLHVIECNKKHGKYAYLRSRWTISWSWRYFTPDNTDLRVARCKCDVRLNRDDKPNDGNSILLREFTPLQYPFEELATSGKLEREVIFTPRLEPIVKFHLKGVG